jgi:LPXTG-motif cell wall-anchored protein/uncharacterized repeat protein (TIGR01451 family)
LAATGPNDGFVDKGDSTVFHVVNPGVPYALAEVIVNGYEAGSWSCDNSELAEIVGNIVTLVDGASVTCTITNDDIAPQLTLVKEVVNDNGGNIPATAWKLSAVGDGGIAAQYGTGGPSTATVGPKTVKANIAYKLGESTVAGYSVKTDWTCTGGKFDAAANTITLALDESVTCTIVNDDESPGLFLKKTVVNDDGGNAVASDWTLWAGELSVTGDKEGVLITDQVGTYALHETGGVGGYSLTSLTCDNAEGSVSSVTIGLGETVTCTFVNDDEPPTLKLLKEVVNDDDGTSAPDDWTLSATAGGDRDFTNPGGSGVFEEVYANTPYLLGEDGPAGYEAGPWMCVEALLGDDQLSEQTVRPEFVPVFQGSVKLHPGQRVVCTIENDDIPLGIDIEKSTNNSGADLPTGPQVRVGDPITWVYTVINNSPVPLGDVVVTDSDPTVTITFVGGDDNSDGLIDPDELWVYKATGVAVAGQYANLGTVTATLDGEIQVTDEDPSHYYGVRPSSLTVSKVALFGDDTFGYLSDALDDFSLTTDGGTATVTFSGLDAGTYDVAEDLDALGEGWSFTGLTCDAVKQEVTGAAATVYLAEGENATCTFMNQYQAPAPPKPALSIEKATNGADADDPDGADVPIIDTGAPVTWTYVVENTGDVDLTGIVVTDDMLGAVCTIDSLAAGESNKETPCTMTGVAGTADYANVGTATAAYGEVKITASDPSHYKVTPPEVLGTAQAGDTVWLDKNKDGKQQADEPGINGAKVFLKDANGTLIATATTAKGPWDGWYKFVGLDAGKYTITLDMTSVTGALTTAGSFTIELVEGQEYLDADFGVAETLPKTGTDAEALSLLALGLLMMGGLAVISTRKRREDT